MQGILDFRGIIGVVLIPYCFIAFWFCAVLFAFHCKLIYLNQSTNENLKNKELELEYFWFFDSK